MLPDGWKGTGIEIESGQSHLFQVRRNGASGALFALKRLKNPARAGRFAREVKTMAALHRHGVSVPEIVASDLAASRPWFAMPWYPAGSLEAALQDRRFVHDRVGGLRTLQQLAATLSDVHANDVAHRDLKPANVLVGGGALALTDFGLCLDLAASDDEAVRLTHVAEAVGSRYYIAPENEGGLNDELDQRPADFYAFGKLAWVLLAGRGPLPREQQLDDEHLLARVLGDARLAPLDTLQRDLLNRDPRARLSDWRIVTDELRAIEAATGGRVQGVPRAARADHVRIARRLRVAEPVTRELEQAALAQRQDRWQRELMEALARRAVEATAALEPLQAELADILDLSASTGGLVDPDRLLEAGVPLFPGGPWSGDPIAAAVVFSIHSPRGLALPSVAIRLWPIANNHEVWFVRVPTIAPVRTQERVARFLLDSIFKLEGPFPAYRQSTVEEGLLVVEETGRLFVSLVEHYLEALDAREDPARAETWADRAVAAVEPAGDV